MATETIQTHLTVSQMTICEILNGGRTEGGRGEVKWRRRASGALTQIEGRSS